MTGAPFFLLLLTGVVLVVVGAVGLARTRRPLYGLPLGLGVGALLLAALWLAVYLVS